MLNVIVAIILTSAFFILFFEPRLRLNSKNESESKQVATAEGFDDDTREVIISGSYPYELMDSKYMYGDIGSFVGYSSIPEDHWLHGFPHEKA